MAVESGKGPPNCAPNLIFITADGDAVTFFIRPSSTKARLRPLIEKAGGLVTSRLNVKEDVIRIAADDDIVTADGYVRAKFVEDCLESGQLLDISNYTCKRMKYTEEDDRNILEYITHHSWQSMRDHFLKHLEGSLPEYITIEKEKQQELLGSGKRDAEDEHDQSKRQRYDEDLEGDTIPQKRQGHIYKFLKNLKDPKTEFEQEKPSDEIESQIIALVKAWSKKYDMSRKAIAVSLYINSGDLDHTEYLLDKRTLHPGES
ncbi:Telomeric repeat-binding factor 2-interacting protein 1 [Holothuria leucospilota]|uniref:Telomeric repeat-binding factor 2-interacting protein 1 n=1 Tax=Holothuria leucospilota TaxID=206669 RepID=A0A9Q1H179_HOLLE|nr:Telomeric repeat-binding factor 2-interacting protein 1 [Holothuria leucospilota]